MREQQPIRLREVLSEWLQKSPVTQPERTAELTRILRETVGEPLGSGLRAISVRRGVLLIEANSSARLHEVAAFRRASILEAFRDRMPASGVTDLRVRPGRVER